MILSVLEGYGYNRYYLVRLIPSVAKVFNRVWGSKVCSPHSETFWPLRQSKIFPLPLIESILKKYYAPENTNVPPNPTLRNARLMDHGRTKIRPKKCLTRTKSTSTGPIRLGTVGMRWPRCRGRGQHHGPALEEVLQDPSPPVMFGQGRPTVCASNRRSPMCFAFSTHWLRSALAIGPSSNCDQ